MKNLYLVKVNKLSTKKRVLRMNLKDAPIVEELESSIEIAELAEEATLPVAIGGNKRESKSSPFLYCIKIEHYTKLSSNYL